jgi:hypothetical protein
MRRPVQVDELERPAIRSNSGSQQPRAIEPARQTEPVVDRTINNASIEIDLDSSRNVTEEDQNHQSSSSEFNTGAESVI